MPNLPIAGPTAAAHPIQIVTRRTGLSADVIRVWEKRYGVVAPVRTATGRRLYSDGDVERLRLLARARLTGHSIRQAAALPPDALAALVRDGAGADGRPHARADTRGPDDATQRAPGLGHLDECLVATAQFDGLALDAALRRATIALSAEAFLDVLVVPLAERVAEQVRDGALRATHRHLLLAALRRVLDHVTAAATSPLAAPHLVVTTPSGQSQELGALVTAAAAAAEGWRVTYVGPGLPAEEVAETVAHVHARAVALSLGAASSDRVIPRELRRLRALLPAGVAILVEGTATDAHRAILGEIHASALHDLPALRARLRTLRDA
jgi:methylmalonyl-CoA mutase cobalamin-binding subunit